MFIELTQVYRASQQDRGGRLLINPNHIISMQTGLVCNNVPTTALAVTLDGYLYVAETPEQIMALIGGHEEPESTKFKVQIPSVNGWADLKASAVVDGGPRVFGPYEVEVYDSEAEALADVRDELKPGEFRIVPSHTPADDDLY
jgi:hypothetical protein